MPDEPQPDEPQPDLTLWVNGIVAARDFMPYVVLSKGERTVAQLSMVQARQIALDLLVFSARTEADAMILKFFNSQKYPDGAATAVMMAFRDFRAELDAGEDRLPT